VFLYTSSSLGRASPLCLRRRNATHHMIDSRPIEFAASTTRVLHTLETFEVRTSLVSLYCLLLRGLGGLRLECDVVVASRLRQVKRSSSKGIFRYSFRSAIVQAEPSKYVATKWSGARGIYRHRQPHHGQQQIPCFLDRGGPTC
jgi:hypothetical protein